MDLKLNESPYYICKSHMFIPPGSVTLKLAKGHYIFKSLQTFLLHHTLVKFRDNIIMTFSIWKLSKKQSR